MPTLCFVVPAHGRVDLARVCLRQLKRTCDALTANGIRASAVVVADDENLATATELGFATVRRDNRFLSARFNDGIQAACDPRFNPHPADYVVPCGSDDWVDHRIFLNLPGPNRVMAFRLAAFVSEDGRHIASREITYTAGVGIRVYPRKVMQAAHYRPADEDRQRACDTSILVNLQRAYRLSGRDLQIVYGDQHPWQIVDWKSADAQLNSYSDIIGRFPRGERPSHPFLTLAGTFPVEALAEMRAHYARLADRVAA